MKKTGLLILMLMFLHVAFSQKKEINQDKRLQGIDAELEKLLTNWNAAGFAVAVVEKNKVVYSKGFGFSDYEKKVPVSTGTVFAIGSCTKAFTTSLLGILESENKLKLTDKPSKYVSELRFFNDQMDQMISIEDLMSHRTGLPRHDFAWYFFPNPSKDSLVKRIQYQKPFAGIRETWYYNNFMYLLQGVIAERITGKTWEENVKERIFKPLGMNNSSLDINGLRNNSMAAKGYKVNSSKSIEKLEYFDISGMSPAGSINSSVDDMSNWLRTWIYSGKFNGKEIIPAGFVQNAMGSHMVINGSLPNMESPDIYFGNYGFGWMITSYKGHYRVEHGGNIDGFSASMCIFPTDSVGIVVLANQDRSVVASIARNMIADRMLNLKKTDWNKKLKEQYDKAEKAEQDAKANSSKNMKSGTRPSHSKLEYTGTYSHAGYGGFEVVFKNDSLFMKSPNKLLWLKHYHYDVFAPYEIVNGKIDSSEMSSIFVNFRTDDMGEISGFTVKIEPTIEAQEFKRKPAYIETNPKDLERYVGEYEIGGTIAKVYLKNEKTFCLFLQGQPEYELLALSKNLFSIKILDGYKVEFVENAEGKIESLFFIQPNGTFKAKKVK